MSISARAADTKIAALYVETDGCYFNQAGVDPWDIARDARQYTGPHPVVCHPPCQRWGRMATGGPSAPNTRVLGDDGGCFIAALSAVQRWGGVLEHPCDSRAWGHYGLRPPKRRVGWCVADDIGWSCYVEQGHYGHMSRKPTWLYAAHVDLPELNWSYGGQRIHPVALARHGYAKARRIGMTAMVGGKDKTKIRNATPPEFRDVLIAMARTAARQTEAV
jgi:hypothetical protein